MNVDFEYIREFYNMQYKKCYLIEEKYDLYLIYAENCFNHYIVCNYMDNMGTVMGQNFFKTLEEARSNFELLCQNREK